MKNQYFVYHPQGVQSFYTRPEAIDRVRELKKTNPKLEGVSLVYGFTVNLDPEELDYEPET